MEIHVIVCLVCGEDCVSKDNVKLGRKGLKFFVTASSERGGHKQKIFEEMAKNNSEFTVHPKCRKIIQERILLNHTINLLQKNHKCPLKLLH